MVYLYKNGSQILGSDYKVLAQTSAGVSKVTAIAGGSVEPFNKPKPVITIPSGSTSATDIWQFDFIFCNVNRDQSALADKTFKGELYIGDVSCT